jgi:hypothetical protein
MTPQRQTVFVATNEKGRGNCMSACIASILNLPIEEVIDTASDEVRDGGFWEPIYQWLQSRGFKALSVAPNSPLLNNKYSIGIGTSPRGKFNHSVVCKNGRMVFDPHPSDDGVVRMISHEVIFKQDGAL